MPRVALHVLSHVSGKQRSTRKFALPFRHHKVGEEQGYVELNHASLPELPKSCRTIGSCIKHILVNVQKNIEQFPHSRLIQWIHFKGVIKRRGNLCSAYFISWNRVRSLRTMSGTVGEMSVEVFWKHCRTCLCWLHVRCYCRRNKTHSGYRLLNGLLGLPMFSYLNTLF